MEDHAQHAAHDLDDGSYSSYLGGTFLNLITG